MTLLRRARVGVGELARLMGEDVDSTRRALRSQSVPLRQSKKHGKLWVYPDELAMHAPELYQAMSRASEVAKRTLGKTGS